MISNEIFDKLNNIERREYGKFMICYSDENFMKMVQNESNGLELGYIPRIQEIAEGICKKFNW